MLENLDFNDNRIVIFKLKIVEIKFVKLLKDRNRNKVGEPEIQSNF